MFIHHNPHVLLLFTMASCWLLGGKATPLRAGSPLPDSAVTVKPVEPYALRGKAGRFDTVDISTTYEISFDSLTGPFRKLHGVNCGPLSKGPWLNHTTFFAQMQPPGIRLHDSMWPGMVVDVHRLFPDFAKDPKNPANYAFADTDRYMKAVVATGAQVLYRLGHSAGNYGFGSGWPYPGKEPRDLRPKDFDKWVSICMHIIRHYNEGWANGFRYNIKKWEIWNEANAEIWWSGTPQEFYQLYERFARAAKREWPTIEVGGFGWVTPDVSINEQSIVTWNRFTDGFLQYCAAHKVPLDFVSWHSYLVWPETILAQSQRVRARLKANGLSHVPDYLGEWSITPVVGTAPDPWGDPNADPQRRRVSFEARRGAPGAAGAVCVLSMLQDAETEAAYYFAADDNPFGMFENTFGAPYKNFFAFKAFNQLCAYPSRVKVSYKQTVSSPDYAFDQLITTHRKAVRGFSVLAAKGANGRSAAILAANYNNPCREYKFDLRGLAGKWKVQVFTIDEQTNLTLVREEPLPEQGPLVTAVPQATVSLLLLEKTSD